MTDARYRRLPGKGRRLGGTDLLLVADDHLLLASRQMYVETYQRFFFADIQAITLRDSRSREIVAALLGGLFLLLAAAFLASDLAGFRVFWGTLAAGTILTSLINWLRGPGVRCHLTTALQTVELTPVNRRPRAKRFIAEMAARIREAQSELPNPEPIPSAVSPEASPETSPATHLAPDGTRAAAPESAPVAAGARSKPPPLPAVYNGSWHWLLFGLLLVDSAITYWQLHTDALTADFIGTTLFLVELGVAILAILRQRVVSVAKPIRTLTWISVGFMLLILIGGWVFGMYIGIANALQVNQGGLVDPVAAQIEAEPLSWISLAGTSLAGIAGLAAMFTDRQRRRVSNLG